MRNRLFNCSNPFQGKDRKVLCVCSAGLLRSPTLANVLFKEYEYNTRAVGTDIGHALIPIDKVHVAWADEILVMDYFQARQVLKLQEEVPFQEKAPIYVLDVPDDYEYMDKTLQGLLLKEYEQVISGKIPEYP